MAWLMVAFFVLLIAPIRAGAALRLEAGGPRGAVGVMIWGLRAQVHISLGRNAEGKLLLTAAIRDKKLPLPPRKRKAGTGIKILGLLLKSNGENSLLRKAVRVNALDIFVRLGGQDAAALALETGFLRGLNPLLPLLHLRCVPALGGQTSVYARCIAEARLGILLAAWLLWRRKQKKSGEE